MFTRAVFVSMAFVAGCAFMTLVVTAAVCGVVGGLLPGDDDDRADADPRPS